MYADAFLKRFYMKGIRYLAEYFSKGEIALWSVSTAFIVISYCIFGGGSCLTLIASVIGTTSLIFNAKGNPFGQLLMVIFSILYGIISFTFSYYGEMITYLGMTAPMALFSLISWLRNPYNGNRSEVTVNRIERKEILLMSVLTVIVTVVFYFILKAFDTANLIPSTLSVTTSFAAVYLTFRRSAFFALWYAANDVVLIILWILASMSDISYLSVVICFIAFLANDIYGFANWRRISMRQKIVKKILL